jgi:hypothetical protein
MISSVAPALLSASTIAESKVGSVIGDSPRIPKGAPSRATHVMGEGIGSLAPGMETDLHG